MAKSCFAVCHSTLLSYLWQEKVNESTKKPYHCDTAEINGRGSKTWTHNLRFWRPLLYQLSYTPMGRLMGIEPMHAGATIQCVNRFTKAAVIIFCKRTREPRDSRVPLRQLPTLPRCLQRSTLGLWTLNYCVRNGNRWYRSGIITASSWVLSTQNFTEETSLQIKAKYLLTWYCRHLLRKRHVL